MNDDTSKIIEFPKLLGKKVNDNEYSILSEKVQKLKVIDIIDIVSNTLNFLTPEQLKQFLKDNQVVLDIVKQFNSYLYNIGLIPIIPVVGSLSIGLEVSYEIRKLLCSLWIAPAGHGKDVVLVNILAKSNPDWFTVLPDKIFESELVTYGKDYFENKIIVHPDLIRAVTGMFKKQKEQLNSFFSGIAEGRYSRSRDKIEDVRTVLLFGIATETFAKYREELFEQTVFDRLMTYQMNPYSMEDQKIIMMQRFNNKPYPAIKLPFPKKKKRIEFNPTEKMKNQIVDFANELSLYRIMSFARAQDYIIIFLKANALLNGRKEVGDSDLLLYQLIHPFFVKSGFSISPEKELQYILIKHRGKPDKELIKLFGKSKPTFYKYKDILRKKGFHG